MAAYIKKEKFLESELISFSILILGPNKTLILLITTSSIRKKKKN